MNRFQYPPIESRASQVAGYTFQRIQDLESRLSDLQYDLRQGEGDPDSLEEQINDIRWELRELRDQV